MSQPVAPKHLWWPLFKVDPNPLEDRLAYVLSILSGLIRTSSLTGDNFSPNKRFSSIERRDFLANTDNLRDWLDFYQTLEKEHADMLLPVMEAWFEFTQGFPPCISYLTRYCAGNLAKHPEIFLSTLHTYDNPVQFFLDVGKHYSHTFDLRAFMLREVVPILAHQKSGIIKYGTLTNSLWHKTQKTMDIDTLSLFVLESFSPVKDLGTFLPIIPAYKDFPNLDVYLDAVCSCIHNSNVEQTLPDFSL